MFGYLSISAWNNATVRPLEEICDVGNRPRPSSETGSCTGSSDRFSFVVVASKTPQANGGPLPSSDMRTTRDSCRR